MRKVIILLIFQLLFSINLIASNLEKELNNSLLYSIGSAAAKAAGLPVDEVKSIATSLKNGDLKTAFLNLASWASDSALEMIPLYGPAKFAVEMVNSFGNVLFTYLGNEVIKSAWKAFINLDDAEKNEWLNGGFVPEIDELYGMRIVDKDKMRRMFAQAWEEYKKQKQNAKTYMDIMGKIAKVIKLAKNKMTPSLYYPPEGGKITINTEIQIWRSKNNYFKIELFLPDGQSVAKIIKDPTDPDKVKITKFKLSDFNNVDWNKYFTQYPDGFNVRIKVTASVYDYTGLMKMIPQVSDLLSPKQSIVMVNGLDGNIFEKTEFSFKVISNYISCEGRIHGTMYFNFYSDYLSDKDSVPLSLNINYQCDKSTGKAKLFLKDENTNISGTCDENGVGKFFTPSGCGNLNFYIKVSCNPLKLSFYSTGECSQTQNVKDEEGNEIPVTVTIKNLKGTLQ